MNFFGYLCLLVIFFLQLSLCRTKSNVTSEVKAAEGAAEPPRGWNSYDSFIWTISEEEFLQNAEVVSTVLLPHGYKYVVVDYLWYRRRVEGSGTNAEGFDVIDQWGRPQPDPERWPSSQNGKGFLEVSKKVHAKGLKFGIHVMRGLSTQAFKANSLILDTATGGAYRESGREWKAQDIGFPNRTCAWMKQGFMSINTQSGAGKAFLRSLYQQYADWGVDFIKHDCVFGDDLDIGEITYVSEILQKLNRPVVYSLSPGTGVTPDTAKKINKLVNMYRVTGDDWDSWGDVLSHFDVARDMAAANMIGAAGLGGKSWPDLDMLPFGWLSDRDSNEGPHRVSVLTQDEQRTQMTLWAMARSPLMFVGDVRKLDNTLLRLITNPTILEINSYSSNNKEFPHVTGEKQSTNKPKVNPDRVFGLTSCTDPMARGWILEASEKDQSRVCWNRRSVTGFKNPFCLSKKNTSLTPEGKLHLSSSKKIEPCLDASPDRRLSAREYGRGSFSPCKNHANQMWELQRNGTLISTYSGLCAMLNPSKASNGINGVRSWIATGRKGEIYLAFFNLNDSNTTTSAKISDLSTALPGKIPQGGSCKSNEIWSRKDLGQIKDQISITLERHASALFVVACNK